MSALAAGLTGALAVWLLVSPPGTRRLVGPSSRGRIPWRRFVPRRRERKEEAAALAALPATLGLLAACLDAGLPLRSAVDAVATGQGPLDTELRAVAARVAVGSDEARAWRDIAPGSVLGAVARDVARSVGSGTALAGALRRHADDAATEAEGAAQAAARAVGVSSVLPLMVCFLPAFLLVGVVPTIAAVAIRLLG